MTELRELSLGATPLGEGRWRFRVWAPRAERVELHLVAPRDRRVPLAPEPRGYHEAVVDGVRDGSLYWYALEGGEAGARQERPDPASRLQPRGVHGPSACVARDFVRPERNWRGLPLADHVFYEIHVGAFTRAGTFDAVIPRLPELRRLGVTALEIMPVAQFPGERNWGYDGVYLFAAQAGYGGPAGLARLVRACHRAGMAAILDVVYNHLGPEGNYLWTYGPYFTDRHKTPWGWAVNYDGAESDEVRRYFVENALWWVREVGFDGLRLDAIHAIHDDSARPFLAELSAEVRAEAERSGRLIHLIAESDRNDARTVIPESEHGLGMDAVWSDDLHHALHGLVTGERDGYYRDFGRLEHLARAWRDGFVYAGQYSEYRKRRHGTVSAAVAGRRFVVCAQNHDQVGNRMIGDRLSARLDGARLRLAAGVALLSPYLPLLFMGEEYGETAPFPYFASHGDAELVRAVREGRRREFEAFGWPGEPPDPFAPETFASARPRWERRRSGEGARRLAFHRAALALRRALPVLTRDDRRDVRTRIDEERNTIVVRRRDRDTEAVLVLAFADGPTDVSVLLARGSWRVALDSADRRWGGPGAERVRGLNSGGRARLLRPEPSILVLSRRR